MSGFSHFAIGLSALRAARLGINVAGLNVANANTPGFSRRRIELQMGPILDVPGGQSSIGVDIASLHRVRDVFRDFGTRQEMSRLGNDQGRTEILSALEPMLGEVDSAPLRLSISNLFDAIDRLAAQPDDVALRGDVISAAKEVAASMHRTDNYVVESQRTADLKVRETAGRANEILGRLEAINRQVVAQEADGDEGSDLRDERDLLVDELSQLVGVRTVESPNGQLSVFLESSGDTLLSGVSARPFTFAYNVDGLAHVTVSRAGEKIDLSTLGAGGKLGGYVAVRDQDLAGYRDRLDTLAAALIDRFNTVHSAGYGLDGSTGQNFFAATTPGTRAAQTMAVDAALAADPRRLAAASAAGEPGNNVNILALLDLREADVDALEGRTLIEYTADLISEVGRDTLLSSASEEASRTIVDALVSQRQQISGVDLDEEAADLMKWQRAYEAAARFMQTADKLTQLAIEMFGG